MKTWSTVLCAAALLGGCSGKKDPEVDAPKVVVEAPKVVVDYDQLERRDGLRYFEEKPFTGVTVRKYPNGQKKEEGTFKDGKLHGLETGWYSNGQKSWETTYEDGQLISRKDWDEDGNPE